MKKILLLLSFVCIKQINAQNNLLHYKPLISFSPTANLRTTTTATCPTSPLALAAQDSLGNTITNGQTLAMGSTPFYIYNLIQSGSTTSPCIQTNFTNFFTSIGTYGIETMYEGGVNTGCIGPINNGCSFPIGQGAVSGTPWSVSLTLLDPSKKHDFIFCRSGSIATTTITLVDCWTGTPLPSNPTSTVFSNATTTITPQACDTLSLPANTDIGTAFYTIAPASASVALTDYNNGEVEMHPNLLQPGTYTVTYNFTPSIASGCVAVTGTFTFTIAPALTLTVTSAAICSGAATTLTASGATNYTWSPATGLNTTTGASVVANPTVTTIYTITGANATADSMGIATSTLTVNPLPPAPIFSGTTGANNYFCEGSSVLLTVNSGSNIAVWYNTNIPFYTGSGCTFPSYPGTYTMSVIDSNTVTGCINASFSAYTTTLTLVINPTPIITYTLVQDVSPHTWDLFYTTTGGSQPYNYTFNWGDGSSINAAYPTHTYSVAGTYSICATVTDNFGCVSTYCKNDAVFRLGNNSAYSSMVNINVKSGTPGALAYQKLLADSVTEFDISAFCPGELKQGYPQTLTNCVNVNSFMGSSIWYAKGDSLYNGKTYKKISYQAQYSSTYVFQGLMREDTIAKKVYFIQYCNTAEDLLYDFSLTQGSTITYSFTNPGYNMPSGVYTVDSVILKHDYTSHYHKHFYLRNHASANNHTLEMIEGVGNITNPLFLYYSFQPNPILTPSTICTAVNYEQGLSCKFDNGTKIYVDSCLFKIANPYGSFQDSCNYCLGAGGGIAQYNSVELVTISPNPNNGNFTVEVSSKEKQTLQMFDINGRLVLSQTMQNKITVDLSNLNEGVYNISLISDQGVVNKRVIIIK